MAVKVKGWIREDDPRVAAVGHPAPPWMTAYADLMTELVCFFVILYALSAALNKNMQEAKSQLEEMMSKGELQGQVQMDKEGLRITLEEQGSVAFFESGRSEITDEMKMKLERISPILKNLSSKHDIVVEGHTDALPIRTPQFASNWELSSARATSVVKHLLAIEFAPKRLSAVGYGEHHPSVPNDSPENRQKNRRVVFFVKNNPYPDSPAVTAAQSAGPPGEAKVQAPAGEEATE